MDYPITETFAPLPTKVLSAEDKITELCQKVDELQALLDNQKRATEAQERSAKNYATTVDNLEAILTPLVSYISEALLESSMFQRQLQELVNDQVRDSFGDSEFCGAVEEVVSNLSFEINVR